MSTSPLGGRVRFQLSGAGDTAPLSTALVRDRLLNNALHFADQNARTLVNWTAPAVAYVRTPVKISTTYEVVDSIGPLPLTLQASGAPYRLRVELLGASSSGGSSVTFACVLSSGPMSDGAAPTDISAISDRAVEFTATTSTTAAWLTAAVGDVLFDPEASLGLSRTRFDTLTDTGGDATAVDVPTVYVTFYAKAAAGATPRMWGAHVSEYVGKI